MITKEQIPLVALDVMNETHFEEAELLNNLENAITDDNNEAINTILTTLTEHTTNHFGNEEKMMQEVNFPAFHMHQGEHIRVLNDMKRIVATWQNSKDNAILKSYFFGEIPQWLDMHIKTMDTITAQFISMHRR